MVTVKPGDVVQQRRGDVVVYQLPFDVWSADLIKPDDKNARVTARVLTGEPIAVKVLDYRPGSQCQEVRITGGGKKRGIYEVQRVVKSATESRMRSFSLQVNP